MRILLATNWLLPHMGGIWTYMSAVRQQLEQLGHEVHLFGKSTHDSYYLLNTGESLDRHQYLHPMFDAKVRPHYHELFRHQLGWVYDVERERYALELTAAYLGLGGYDLIYTQDVIASYAFSRVKPRHIPLIGSIHGDVVKEVALTWPKEEVSRHRSLALKYYAFIERMGVSFSDVCVTSCEYMKNKLMLEHGIPEDQFRVIPLGIDIPSFEQRMHQAPPLAHPGRKVIFFAARLSRYKGIDVLLRALTMLKRQRSDWVCWLAGDGEARADLQQQTQELNLQDEVHFLGARDDVPALMRQADIFVLPSVHETLPYSVMEAQLAGKAVVGSDVGGTPELMQDGSGLLFGSGHAGQLSEHLNLLLDNDAYRLQLGAQARQWALNRYSSELMIHRLLGLFEETMARQRKRG